MKRVGGWILTILGGWLILSAVVGLIAYWRSGPVLTVITAVIIASIGGLLIGAGGRLRHPDRPVVRRDGPRVGFDDDQGYD